MINKTITIKHRFLNWQGKRFPLFFIFLLSFVFIANRYVQADVLTEHQVTTSDSLATDSLKTERKIHTHLAWLNVGLGVGTSGMSGILSSSYQFNNSLISLRMAVTAELFGNEYWDAGLLYGWASRKYKSHQSFSLGLSMTGGSLSDGSFFSDEPRETLPVTIGFCMEFQLFFRPTGSFGLGLNGFGNMNSNQAFAGLALALQFGRIR